MQEKKIDWERLTVIPPESAPEEIIIPEPKIRSIDWSSLTRISEDEEEILLEEAPQKEIDWTQLTSHISKDEE